MPRPLTEVPLEAGKVYRTACLRRFGDNPTRLAQRLEARGLVRRLGHGLFYALKPSHLGEVPPSDEALLDAFLDGTPYLVTGPPRWNALGLGSFTPLMHPLVYNTKRSGSFVLGGQTFTLQRVAFPTVPPSEWFVVDLLRHANSAGADRDALVRALAERLADRRFDADALMRMAEQFGQRAEMDAIRGALALSQRVTSVVRNGASDNRQLQAGDDMTPTNAIQARIQGHGPGWVFTPGDFIDLASRSAVDQALSRLARHDAIRRLDRGVYDVPHVHPRLGRLWPAADTVARAVAASTDSQLLPSGAAAANALGLTTQVPARPDYLTDGRARRVRVGKLDIRLRRASRIDLLLPGTRAGAALSALHYLGRAGLHEAMVRALQSQLDDDDKRHLTSVRRKVPGWLAGVIDRVAAPAAP